MISSSLLDGRRKIPKYAVDVQLTGSDGNAFAVLAVVRRALRKAGASKSELDAYISEATSGD